MEHRMVMGMSGRMRGIALLFGVAVTLILWSRPLCARDDSTEALKAAFVHHVLRYASWPARAFSSPSAPIAFCIFGDGTELTYFRDRIEGSRIGGREIVITALRKPQEASRCHVLVATGEDSAEVDQALRYVEGRCVLTLAEFERFDQRGGIIRFWLETPESDGAQPGIRFAVNLEVADRVGITLSSKVLRHAAAREER